MGAQAIDIPSDSRNVLKEKAKTEGGVESTEGGGEGAEGGKEKVHL